MSAAVRPADGDDVPDAVRMGLAFRAKFAPHLRENPAQMETIALWLIGGGGRLFVAEVDGAVVGMLGLALITHPLSGDRYASELFWWVDPGTPPGTGLRLLATAERWAKEQGALAVHMVALASNQGVDRIYERRGYVPRDTTWERTL